MQIGIVVLFRGPPKGERLAIVGLKFASFRDASAAKFGWQVTACARPSPKRKISPRGAVAKRQVNEDPWGLLVRLFDTTSAFWSEIRDIHLSECFCRQKAQISHMPTSGLRRRVRLKT